MAKNPTRKRSIVKPIKPHPDLWLHPSGRWCKKIKGRAYYFGKTDDDPIQVVRQYLAVRDDLLAGRTPRTLPEGLTVRELANRFMTSKKALLLNAEIVQRTFDDYYVVCRRVVDVFGPKRLVVDLAASDFAELRAAFAKTRGPVSLTNDITRVRSVFKFGFDEGLIDRPIRYGQSFKRPSRKVLRKVRNGNGPKLFAAGEIRSMIGAAGPQLRAMILLGVNCGFGNSDCGNLPTKALDLVGGWIDYPRPKTGIGRRVPLWSQTIVALRVAIAQRPKPRDKADVGLVFITAKGLPWAKQHADNPLSKEFAKLQKALGIHRKGRGFYALRHVFQTVADEARDPVATRAVMGHSPDASDMSAVYRESVSDERLRAVTDHVRRWLFDVDQDKPKE